MVIASTAAEFVLCDLDLAGDICSDGFSAAR